MEEDDFGRMVRIETRTYAKDRSVTVSHPDAEGSEEKETLKEKSIEEKQTLKAESSEENEILKATRSEEKETGKAETNDERAALKEVGRVEVESEQVADGAAHQPAEKEQVKHLSWVARSLAEVEGDKVRAEVALREDLAIDMSNLSLDVAPEVLRVAFGEEVLELPLPATVCATTAPSAKWSKKTRTLTMRLEIVHG